MNKIISKEHFSEKVFKLVIEAPLIAKSRKAGHFVIVRVGEKGERMPLTIAAADPKAGTITLVVQEVGLSSTRLCELNEGDYITDVVGPLGQATHIENFGTVVCAGGGVGVAPMLPIVQALKAAGNRVITVLAGRSKELIILEKEMRESSDEVIIMTDDGSYGRKGLVTEGVEEVIKREKVNKCFAIGPAIMMKFVCLLTKKYEIPTEVSLNTIMVDGTGMCGACRITIGGKTKFVCVDGPEFDGHQVDFDEMLKRMGAFKTIEREELVDCNTVVIHGIHQFTPTILSMLEEVSKYKRVVLLFNYQQQYNEIYQTWLDVYSCFDLNIKSQFNNEFKPTTLLQPSYEGNMLADQIGRLANGTLIEKNKDINNVKVVEFDNITEFSAYVARIYEEAAKDFHADEHKNGSVLSYMKEQFYSANNSVNDILKVYFPEQFGERHFLAYPIGHFFVAVTNMWDSENGGIRIENMNDIAECLYSGALHEKKVGSLVTPSFE